MSVREEVKSDELASKAYGQVTSLSKWPSSSGTNEVPPSTLAR